MIIQGNYNYFVNKGEMMGPMQNSGMIAKGVLLSSAMYVIPKILGYLCTKPDNIVTRVDKLRESLYYLKESYKQQVGLKGWLFTTKIMAENAWISTLVLTLLVSTVKQPLDEGQKINLVFGFFCFATFSCFLRHRNSFAE